MGTYIAMGSAFKYHVEKKELKKTLLWHRIKDKTNEEIRTELSKNFSADLYKCTEDENWFHYELSNDIPVNDFIELYDEFNKITRPDSESLACIKAIRKDICQMSSINEIYDFANNGRIRFWSIDLPYYCHHHHFTMFGKEIYAATSVDGPALYIGCGKTLCEAPSESFDLFTDFLQTCLKHTKLGSTMLVYVTA